LNSVFAQCEELSSPQITANFGLDNSSYRAQPHSIIIELINPFENFAIAPPKILHFQHPTPSIKIKIG
jgi:hypothetical protein